jgi:hypothetical protein
MPLTVLPSTSVHVVRAHPRNRHARFVLACMRRVGMSCLVKQGVGAAFRIGSIGMGLPTRSSLAFLKGSYKLEGEAAKPALAMSYLAAIVATLVCAFVITGAVVVAIIF